MKSVTSFQGRHSPGVYPEDDAGESERRGYTVQAASSGSSESSTIMGPYYGKTEQKMRI